MAESSGAARLSASRSWVLKSKLQAWSVKCKCLEQKQLPQRQVPDATAQGFRRREQTPQRGPFALLLPLLLVLRVLSPLPLPLPLQGVQRAAVMDVAPGVARSAWASLHFVVVADLLSAAGVRGGGTAEGEGT